MDPKGQSSFISEHGFSAGAISDLDSKKAKVLEALRNSGVDSKELAAVTVMALLDHVPDKPVGPVAPPVDGRLAAQLVARNVDRTANLNLAATAIMGAAL